MPNSETLSRPVVAKIISIQSCNWLIFLTYDDAIYMSQKEMSIDISLAKSRLAESGLPLQSNVKVKLLKKSANESK